MKRKFGYELEFTWFDFDDERWDDGCDDNPRNFLVKVINNVKGHVAVKRSCQHKKWYVKYDSTCAYEIASPVFQGLGQLRDSLRVVKALQKNHCKVDYNCGFHVHVDVSDFNNDNIQNIVKWWIKIENVISQCFPSHRRDYDAYNPLLSSMLDELRLSELYEDDYDSSREREQNCLNELICSLRTYRPALSLRNWKNVGAEFRIGEGTVNPETVNYWVRFLLCFVNQVKRSKVPDNLKPMTIKEMFDWLGLRINGSSRARRLRRWILIRIAKNGDYRLKKQSLKTLRVKRKNLSCLKI